MTALSGTALWTAEDAAAATGGKLAPGAVWSADGVSIDTRSVAPRDLFVALKGPRFDGHNFVETALSNGAAAAMIDRALPSVDAKRLLSVPDTQAGLEALARAARARSQAKIVAVTGSVGKTGTKEALAKLLSAQGPTHASAGNLNNQIGTPLSLARLPASARYAIFELGMNHENEIRPLTRLVRPHAAIVTTIEAVHLEYFSGVEGIADAKAEIFEGIEPGGAAILNRDNPQFGRLAAKAKACNVARIWSFGVAEDADARLVSADLRADGSSAEAVILGRRLRFELPLPGRHHVQNALGVLLAVAALDADVAAAAAGLSMLTAVKGRGAAIDVSLGDGHFRLIDESYNASPAAMRAAFGVLAMTAPAPGGRRIAILGDMLELGTAAPEQHAALAQDLAAAGVAQVFTAGPLMRHLYNALPAAMRGGHEDQAAALVQRAADAVRSGDVVLVKGSAGSRMGGIVAALRALAPKLGEARHAV